jgi:hypothetical protein
MTERNCAILHQLLDGNGFLSPLERAPEPTTTDYTHAAIAENLRGAQPSLAWRGEAIDLILFSLKFRLGRRRPWALQCVCQGAACASRSATKGRRRRPEPLAGTSKKCSTRPGWPSISEPASAYVIVSNMSRCIACIRHFYMHTYIQCICIPPNAYVHMCMYCMYMYVYEYM